MARVLIVDDSGFTRRTHRRMLETAGHVVVEAMSGMEALESYAMDRPDLVLLDLTMADMTGLEVIDRLKEFDASARVLVISADVQRTTRDLVLGSGARDFLAKPVAADVLAETVRTLLLDA